MIKYIMILSILVLSSFIFIQQRKSVIIQSELLTPMPTITQLPLEMTGWFSYYDEVKSRQSLQSVFPHLQIFSPALYEISSDGQLKVVTIKNKEVILNEAKNYNLPMYPVINDGSQRRKLLNLLNDQQKKEKFTDDLLNQAQIYGFKGFTLDFEALKSEDKDIFIEFCQYLFNKLKENNLEFHNILYGREEQETYNPALAHPYKELSDYADRIYLMIFNYNNEFTSPGGQTPIKWYRSVLKYAVKSIPREKIAIGLSSHGYQWNDAKTIGLTYPEIERIINSVNPQINYDSSQSAKSFKFQKNGQENTVFFDDSQTILEKMQIAQKEYGINKFAIWRIGAEDPSIWSKLNNINK